MKNNTDEKNYDVPDGIKNLMIAIASCAFAPLISHWLDVCMGSGINVWTTDKLIILFFSAISGWVIWDKICREYKKTRLFSEGLDLDNAGAAEQLIWTMPSMMVLLFYDTVFGATAIVVFFIIAIIIMWRDRDDIKNIKGAYFLVGSYEIIVIIIQFIYPFKVHIKEWLIIVPIVFLVNVASWIAGELISKALRQRR